MQIYVPEPMTMVRDSGGRVVAIADNRGRRVEVDYVGRATELDGRFLPDFQLAASAWAATFCEQAGRCASGTRTVNLAETVAVPGHRGRQRLGLSGRSQR